MSVNATAIVQARMGSRRLPGKSLEVIAGVPAIEIVLRRLARASRLDRIVLATSDHERDSPLARHVEKIGFPVFRGSENDLLERFVGAAARFVSGAYIVRATGDNVFMDPNEVDRVVEFGIAGKWDFVGFSNRVHKDRINDFAAEFLRRDALEEVSRSTADPHDREHVFPYFYAHPERFRVTRIEVDDRLHTAAKLDLDFPDDLERMRAICRDVADPVSISTAEIVSLANWRFHSSSTGN